MAKKWLCLLFLFVVLSEICSFRHQFVIFVNGMKSFEHDLLFLQTGTQFCCFYLLFSKLNLFSNKASEQRKKMVT